MEILIIILTSIIAFEHLGFLYLETFLWTKPLGRKVFGNNLEDAEKTKTLAANQGLYNGFLSAGLIWGLLHPNPAFGTQIIFFFLACIIVAGIYGGITAKRTILYIQALPALITAIFMLI